MIDNNYISKSNISDITPEDFQLISDTRVMKYLNSLKESGMKVSTIATKRNVLSGFWTFLEYEKYVDTNVIRRILAKKYKNKRNVVKLLTDDALNQFIENIKSISEDFQRIQNMSIVNLFIGSGIRESELIGLDMKRFVFRKRRSLYYNHIKRRTRRRV